LPNCLFDSQEKGIDKIIYSCEDKKGGATNIRPEMIGFKGTYEKGWPKIEYGLYENESCELIVEFMNKNKKNWKDYLPSFEGTLKKVRERYNIIS